VVALTLTALIGNPASSQSRSPASASTPASWLQLRGATDNTGRLPGTLEVAWRFKARHAVRGLSVAAGLVLVGTESADAASRNPGPDQRGYLTALDALTGIPLWTQEVPNWIHGDPVIYRGLAFASFGRFPMTSPGGVIAVDLRTGRTVWSLNADGGIMPAPALDSAEGSLIVAGGDGVLRTLDVRTGAVKHASVLGSPDAMASPRIDDNGVVYLGADATLFSYSTRTGRFLWRFRPPGLVELGTPPAALADTIVFTEGTKHLGLWSAFRALPIRRFWQLAREGRSMFGNRLSTYASWFQEQWLLAVDRRDGHPLWQQPLGVGLIVLRNNSGTPVVAGKRVIISSPVSQTVSAFDVASGRVLWRRRLDAMHIGAATIVGSDIVLGDKNGYITLLRIDDGRVIGRCNAGAAFSPTAPVVVGRTLFTATRDGWVRATPYDSLRHRAILPGGTACF
jgi:outer membrane protein assembly factor BamB